LPWIHLGSIALSQGLLVGNRHATIRTPWPLALTWRLWAAIHLRTSRLMCQLALSQINSRAFLPRALSLWQHHERNRVVLWSSRVGPRRTLSKSLQVPAHTARSRRGLWGRDRPCSALCGGGAPGGPPRPRSAETASQSEKTSSHPRSPKPTEDRSGPAGSADLEPLFSGVFGIGALYPAFGPLPAHPKPCQCRPYALATDLSFG
jgi:hypothetical protein